MKRQRWYYETADGRSPFDDWISGLRDLAARLKIYVRIDRAEKGNLGNHRFLGGGLLELKIDFGPGYRVYIGLHGEQLIVLLCGGDKSTQDRDIASAREYWEDWKRNNETSQEL